ncbi:GRB2-related adapter protein, partial [Takifugu flavidus]
NWLLSLFIHEATLFPQWTPLFGMEAVALFSFPATEADELSFQKGDIIKVTEMEDDSGWFTAEIQGKRGYIPQNYISLLPYPWFVGRVSRLEAEKRLRCQDTGVFLVRESESAPGEFSVSVSYGNRVEHFRVLEGGGQYCIWEETFCSLNRLVDFYRTHSIAVDKVVCLRDPPLSPQLHVQSGCNPYPNPYKNCSQESLHTAHLHSHHERESGRQLDLGKTRLAHALCDYTPPHTAHLHFLRGDVIDLLDCSSALSWRGRCRGRVGVFPPACVQPLHH